MLDLTKPLKPADTRLAEIRERLAKATPGPWERDDPNTNLIAGRCKAGHYDYVCTVWRDDVDHAICPHGRLEAEAEANQEANANLIANAPSDLDYTLSLIEGRDTELATMRAVVDVAEKINHMNVERAQMTAREHGDNLYRDYFATRNGKLDRELDEAFQALYECRQALTTAKDKPV